MKITQITATPLKTGPMLIQIGDPDILQPDIVNAGGISEVRKIYTLAETFNKPVMPHCLSPGISSAASLHLYATATNAVRQHEYSEENLLAALRYNLGREFTSTVHDIDALFEEPFVLKDGHVGIPDRPGLGLVVDKSALDALRLE